MKMSKLACDNCGKNFKAESNLFKHRTTAKYCRKFNGIMFSCEKCRYIGKGMYDIQQHVMDCDNDAVEGVNYLERMTALEEERQSFQVRSSSLEAKLSKQALILVKAQLRLKMAEMQIKIYEEIIKKYTEFNPDDILEERNDGVHIHNVKNCRIPVIVHEFVEDNAEDPKPEKMALTVPKSRPRKLSDGKRVIYRAVPKAPDPPQDDEEQKEIIKKTDEEINAIQDAHFEETAGSIKADIEELLASIMENRVYTQNMVRIKKKMHKLIGRVNVDDYCEILRENVAALTKLFEGKQYDERKITKIMPKGLSALDMRLIRFKGYTNTDLEVDDIQTFKLSLEVQVIFPKVHIPFDAEIFHPSFNNYSVALFPLKFCIERLIINKYGFHNLVYADIAKSSEEDPFSFYTLEKTDGDKLFWKMDCRLEDFTHYFIDNVLPFCITLFRLLYSDVFGDNEFRVNYTSFSPITECDCEQLLHNILIMSDPMKCGNLLREIVKKGASIVPTTNDKFNLSGDDKIQQRRFKKYVDPEDTTVFFRMFDNISSTEVTQLYASKMA